MDNLSIITVCLKKHYWYVRCQLSLIKALNPWSDWQMVVVDNEIDNSHRLVISDQQCSVIPGVEPDLTKPEECRGSYHHAAALHKALEGIKSRYLLIMDPDLFVIYRNWISECLQHMKKKQLSVFGVPWHPRWYNKYRYFPCVHFLLIDLEKVNRKDLDFTPNLAEKSTLLYRINQAMKKVQRQSLSSRKCKTDSLISLVKMVGIFKAFWGGGLYVLWHRFPMIFGRFRIHASRDTGWKIWHTLKESQSHLFDVVLPVVNLKTELTKPSYVQTWWGKGLEQLLPREWSFLPAPGTYLSPNSAPGFDLPLFRILKPEMFVWRGAPFAFHLRGYYWDAVLGGRNPKEEEYYLQTFLNSILEDPYWYSWIHLGSVIRCHSDWRALEDSKDTTSESLVEP